MNYYSHNFILHNPEELIEHDWFNEFEKLKIYVGTFGYKVVFGMVDEIHFDKKEIIINRNRIPRNRCYVLAHEIGHAHVRKRYENVFIERFPGYAFIEKSKGYNVSKIEEEVLAWDEAINVLRSLRVPIDEYAFNRVKQICLSSYLV